MRVLLLALLGLVTFGCTSPTSVLPPGSEKVSKEPTPPLQLAAPPLPGKDLGEVDLSSVSAQELAEGGSLFIAEGRWDEAARCLAWAVSRGADQRYNLACALARNNQLEAAFYWLQKAALEEGVDADWAKRDPDLAHLRSDPRWSQVGPFLGACNAYYAQQDLLRVSCVVPEGYDPAQPIVTVVGLHGLGGDEAFINENYQALSNRLGVAFAGVSGTRALGPQSYSWSEDREQDHRQVQRGLQALKQKLTPGQGSIVLFGFSQGGQMAFELAAAYPESYVGALSMSPGLRDDGELSGLTASPGNKRQRFILVAGEEEHPGTVACARADADWARRAGAQAKLKLYPKVSQHAFPPDFQEAFPGWLDWLQGK
jgi:predicted esterase